MSKPSPQTPAATTNQPIPPQVNVETENSQQPTHNTDHQTPENDHKNKYIVTIGVLLTIIAIALVAMVFLIKNYFSAQTPQEPTPQPTPTPIKIKSAEEQELENLDLDTQELDQELEDIELDIQAI